MNKTNDEITGLRTDRAQLEAKIRTAEDADLPLHNQRSSVEQAIAEADAVIIKSYRFPDTQNAQAAKSSALFQRAKIDKQLQNNRRHLDFLKDQLTKLRRKLHRTEYDAVSTADLAEQLAEHVAGIRTVESDKEILIFERKTLQTKKQEALAASNSIDQASRDLREAREALEEALAAGFIAGLDVDTSIQADRVTKAERQLSVATKGTAAGSVALPRISARLEDIDDEIADLEQRRRQLESQWYQTRARMVDIECREQALRTVEVFIQREALDAKTGGRLGYDLTTSLRDALRLPLLGKHTERLPLHTPDLAGVLATFEVELVAALGDDQEM